MSVDFWYHWGAPIGLVVVQLAIAWLVWSLRNGFVSREHCEKHRIARTSEGVRHHREIKGQAERASTDVAALKNKIEALPTRSEMRALTAEISNMNKSIGKLEGRLGGVGRAVDLVNQHLINTGKNE